MTQQRLAPLLMLFPTDALVAQIVTGASGGTTCGTLIPATSTEMTILSAQIVTNVNAEHTILIGSNIIHKVLNTQPSEQSYFPYIFSNQAVTCTRANNANTLNRVVYVPYNIEQTPSSTLVSISSGSTTPSIVNGFTRGELVNGFFILSLLVMISYAFLYIWIKGVKINS